MTKHSKYTQQPLNSRRKMAVRNIYFQEGQIITSLLMCDHWTVFADIDRGHRLCKLRSRIWSTTEECWESLRRWYLLGLISHKNSQTWRGFGKLKTLQFCWRHSSSGYPRTVYHRWLYTDTSVVFEWYHGQVVIVSSHKPLWQLNRKKSVNTQKRHWLYKTISLDCWVIVHHNATD